MRYIMITPYRQMESKCSIHSDVSNHKLFTIWIYVNDSRCNKPKKELCKQV